MLSHVPIEYRRLGCEGWCNNITSPLGDPLYCSIDNSMAMVTTEAYDRIKSNRSQIDVN